MGTNTNSSLLIMLKLITILSILLISIHPQNAFKTRYEYQEDEEDERYIIDSPFASTHRLRSRFLASIKKGTHCYPNNNNVCNGVEANNGTGLLHCCKTHCRDFLNDHNNCGYCGKKCDAHHTCCGGYCTHVFTSTAHCGKCHGPCEPGTECNNGICGYA